MKFYGYIADSSKEIIGAYPVVIPKTGRLAGFSDEFSYRPSYFSASDNNHYPAGMSWLKLGVRGVAETARSNISDKKTELQNDLLEGVGVVYDAVADYFAKYPPVIDALLADTDNPDEVARLTHIRANMEALSVREPVSFAEALQLYYLMWRIRSTNQTACIGRTDQHLGRFLEEDLRSGIITEEEALGYLCDMYELCNRCGSGDTLMNIMVGGMNPDGSDASNRLSVLLLEAGIRVGKSEPHINLRWHHGLSRKVLDAALRLQNLGGGQASFYNDEVLIPSLIKRGFRVFDSYNYTNDGCTEIMLDGASRIDFNHIDAVATLELAMNRGALVDKSAYERKVHYYSNATEPYIYKPDVEVGFDSGDAESAGSFEELFECYLRQYEYQLRDRMDKLREFDRTNKQYGMSSLFLNGSFPQVLESGTDILRGGLENDCYMILVGSMTTAADALYAMKVKVFEQKKYTVKEIKAAIEADYAGYEAMRQELLNTDKFGNDIDGPDLIAARIASDVCDFMRDYSKKTGFQVLPAFIGWRFIEEAYGTAASADGRHYCDPIAEHYCATPGRAKNGPTALINSVAKADIGRATGAAPTHISLPRNFATDEKSACELLSILDETAMEKGLVMLNIAVYDEKRLRMAQTDPEHNGDIIVRVWGYSARFVDLCREMQDHIIERILS